MFHCGPKTLLIAPVSRPFAIMREFAQRMWPDRGLVAVYGWFGAGYELRIMALDEVATAPPGLFDDGIADAPGLLELLLGRERLLVRSLEPKSGWLVFDGRTSRLSDATGLVGALREFRAAGGSAFT
jgi:hypothetical protein